MNPPSATQNSTPRPRDETTAALSYSATALLTLRTWGTALLVISDDIPLHCLPALVLDRGSVVGPGPTAALLSAPAHPANRALLGRARISIERG
ncbi:hypothetical protein AB0H71_24150 [Nocardia sp. NPDC050697]|uniref:hypothetical protein n=1 Tax=Nocardia sp. NPDC050697 TaxID=3155158 RepID=UPI0033F1E311